MFSSRRYYKLWNLHPYFQTFFALVIIILAWTVGLVWIESAGSVEQSSDTGFVTYVKNQALALMVIFHMFGLLWLLQFAIACQHMVSSSKYNRIHRRFSIRSHVNLRLIIPNK